MSTTASDVANPNRPAHLLIIDDEPKSVASVIEYLRAYDFAVKTATNGFEGLNTARTTNPDVILVDLNMPALSGFEVIHSLKHSERTRTIPVLVLSGREDTASKLRGFALGASDYITKPVAQEELLARIKIQLGNRHTQSLLESKLQIYEQRYGTLSDDAEDTLKAGVTNTELKRLSRARQILRENLANPPSLNQLARTLGTNQPRLSRSFRALFGTTVFGFVRELRLQRARGLLLETDLPVKSIALEVGYRNTSDLTRGIKDRFGMTPTDLRLHT